MGATGAGGHRARAARQCASSLRLVARCALQLMHTQAHASRTRRHTDTQHTRARAHANEHKCAHNIDTGHTAQLACPGLGIFKSCASLRIARGIRYLVGRVGGRWFFGESSLLGMNYSTLDGFYFILYPGMLFFGESGLLENHSNLRQGMLHTAEEVFLYLVSWYVVLY